MFSFSYEDSDVEIESIKKYLSKNSKDKIDSGLMILSGGCTMFDIAKYFNNLTACDINPKQIDWVKQKITLLNTDLYRDLLESSDFVFDKMFQEIKAKHNFSQVFSRENLIKQFGPNAVLNTSEDFSSHFEKIYNSKSKYHGWIFNRNYNQKNKLYNSHDIESIKSVSLLNSNLIDNLDNKKYDFIQTSNITDWLDSKTFEETIKKLKLALNPGGVLVMRRLLSDNILSDKFDKDTYELVEDCTLFYKETLIFIA